MSSSRSAACSNRITGSPREIFRLFSESKRIAYERGNFGNPGYLYFEHSDRASQEQMVGTDPFPFGIANNRQCWKRFSATPTKKV